MLGHDKGIGVDGSGHGLKIPLVCALQVCARPGEFCCHVNMCQQCRVEQRCLGARPCSQHIALPGCLLQQASCLACWMQPPECVGVLPQCLPQRPKTLWCMCGCQGQPCDPGCLAATPINLLAGVQHAAARPARHPGLPCCLPHTPEHVLCSVRQPRCAERLLCHRWLRGAAAAAQHSLAQCGCRLDSLPPVQPRLPWRAFSPQQPPALGLTA